MQQKHFLLYNNQVLRRDSSIKLWDFDASRWDSQVWMAGFIFSMFYRWDFSVPELNIYYYKVLPLSTGSRIPAGIKFEKMIAKILRGGGGNWNWK